MHQHRRQLPLHLPPLLLTPYPKQAAIHLHSRLQLPHTARLIMRLLREHKEGFKRHGRLLQDPRVEEESYDLHGRDQDAVIGQMAPHEREQRVADKLGVGGGDEAEVVEGGAARADQALGAGVGGGHVAFEEVGAPLAVVVAEEGEEEPGGCSGGLEVEEPAEVGLRGGEVAGVAFALPGRS